MPDKKLQIRSRKTDFLVFTERAVEDVIEVRAFKDSVLSKIFSLAEGGADKRFCMSDFQIERYQTPYKSNRAVLFPTRKPGDYNAEGVDAPFVFKHNGKYFILHIGFDGKGYQTALSVSDRIDGEYTLYSLVFAHGEGNGWDSNNTAGVYITSTQNLFEPRTLRKINGKYYMLYHAYPGIGYESGPASIGIAWCEDEDLKRWHRLERPIMVPEEKYPWESGGLYKECLVEKDGIFYMLYNAKDSPADGSLWLEQIGLATSKDLIHWEKYPQNPVLKVSEGGIDSQFISDPFVVSDGDLWINFYYTFDGIIARGNVGYSRDLIHWEKYGGILLDHGEKGSIDDTYAHKSCVFYENGTLYHFYCAVSFPGGKEERVITYASSRRAE